MYSTLKTTTFLTVSIFMFTLGCGGKDNGHSGSCDNSSTDGYYSFTEGDSTREYILQLPTGYDDSSDPLPLVINFHGNGGCAGDFSTGAYAGDGLSDLSTQANANNFIVAYPQGVARAKGGTEWDPGTSGPSNLNDNDVYFVQQLIADINVNHPVDSTRIYATGYSNGGMMAYGLACEAGSQIAAVGIMSGIMLEGTCVETDYTPVIHFHGTADDALPYAGNMDFQSVATVISFWVNHNQIPDTTPTTTTLNNGQVTLDSYTGGAEGSSVLLYTIDGGGHVWFDENIDRQHPNDILWEFLAGYDVNGSL